MFNENEDKRFKTLIKCRVYDFTICVSVQKIISQDLQTSRFFL